MFTSAHGPADLWFEVECALKPGPQDCAEVAVGQASGGPPTVRCLLYAIKHKGYSAPTSELNRSLHDGFKLASQRGIVEYAEADGQEIAVRTPEPGRDMYRLQFIEGPPNWLWLRWFNGAVHSRMFSCRGTMGHGVRAR